MYTLALPLLLPNKPVKKKRLKAKTYVKMGYVKWFYTSFRTINIGLNIINKKILSVKFFKF